MATNVFGLIYAGEQNINLRELIYFRAVGALPIGGRYRSIDFILSNMVNSGIRNVGVIAQKNYHSLMDHLGSGKEWDLSRKSDGLFILPPFDTMENTGTYRGIIDAVKNAMNYIKRAKQQYCLLSGSYTIYSALYDEMVERHIQSGSDITILYNDEDNIGEYESRFKDVRLYTDENDRVIDIEYNSLNSKSRKAGMDIYLIRKDLLEYLVEDAFSRGKYHFVTDVLLANINRLKISAYKHNGYVGRINSVADYYKINMDMLGPDVQKALFFTGSPVYTKIKDEVPAKYGENALVKNSLVANGCIIEGEVENSILFRGVYVGKGAKIKNSLIMQDSEIYNDCDLDYVILDKHVHVRTGRKLVGTENFPAIIRKGAIV